MASADVTIRGAGIFGLATAWACVKRGLKVRVTDPFGIGAGASGGVVGALAPHAPENWNPMKQFQFESLTMAGAWWAEVQEAGGADPLYARTGRLQPVLSESGLAAARDRESAAQSLWQGQAEWRVIPCGSSDWEPESPTGLLIRDTLTARISPRAALHSLASALRARGAEIVTGAAAEEGMILHASGVTGLAEFSEAFGRKLGGGVKGQAALLAHDARSLPQIYTDGLYIIPHGDGLTAIGSTSENSWEAEGTDHQAPELVEKARALLPLLREAEVTEYWAGIRPRAKSRSPVIGAWPGREGHFIANGGFKTGFGMAPKCAELLGDLLAGQGDAIPQPFRPESLL